jgi:tRNA-intron endonuclease, archaea type
MITAHLSGLRIVSTSEGAFSLYEKSQFGEKKSGRIEYSGVEAIFLVGRGRMTVVSGKKEISEDMLIRKIRRGDKKIELKSSVFSDLRKKGYIVKTALKFGAEFRVYSKGVKPGQDHAKWIVFVVSENEKVDWREFSAKNRVAHSTKKKLLLAVVDEEGDVIYYEVGWLKP